MPKASKKLASKEESTQEAVDIVEVIEEKEVLKSLDKKGFNEEAWKPKSSLGKKVKAREIQDIDYILDNGYRIMEPEIVDMLLPGLIVDLLLIGQSKGKFGGGQRRVFKQTQKKTAEGNKPKFATYAVVGNENGYVGLGYGKAKETVPAREKAIRNAKLNIIKIIRGCGSWRCGCGEPHTIPFKARGKNGSSIMEIMPAPKGTGLKIEKECAKILKLAGIKDVWSKTIKGSTKMNIINSCLNALKQLSATKVNPATAKRLGIVEGAIKREAGEIKEEELEKQKNG